VVFHLAAEVRRERFDEQPHEAYNVNTAGTLAVLNYCYRTGARCVFMSTSGVYEGSAADEKFTEESPIGPASDYAMSKWLAEGLCRRQAIDLGVESVVLRLFNAYGPGQRSSYIVPHVIKSILQQKPLALRMSEARRDFIHVDDVVEALLKAAITKVDSTVFNIGRGCGTRIIDLVRLCEDLLGETAEIVEAEAHSGETMSAVADIERAERELGWTPTRGLRSGLIDLGSSMAKLARPSDAQSRLAG